MFEELLTDMSIDPSYLTDRILSFDGLMAIGGLAGFMAGSTMLTKFFSGGQKNWMSPHEARRAGLYGNKQKGIILGRYNGTLICSTNNDQIGVDGTTGTGKTANAFLATLLSNTFFGWLIYDQSGDLWKKTSGRRAEYGPVYRLYPGDKNSHSYNPFVDLPRNDRIISNLSAIYEPLFEGSANDQKQTGGNPFFKNEGKGILPFITIQVLYGEDASKKNIGGVLEYINDGESCFVDMARNPKLPKCASIGRQYMAMNEATRTSIMSNIYQALSLWRDEAICKMTETSSFRIADLATSEKPISIYLCAPATDIKRILPFYVVIEEMLKIHLMKDSFKTLNGEEKIRNVCISDDEAQNTRRPSLDALEISRKFGIRFFLGYQSLYAMGQIYGDDKLGLLRTKLSLKPPPHPKDIYVNGLIALSGTYKKKVVSNSSNSSSKGGGSSGKSWSIKELPRMSKLDFENWEPFGNGLLTHMGGRPAIIETFDAEQDKEFKKLIMPEAYINVSWPVKSHWGNFSVDIVEHNMIQETIDSGIISEIEHKEREQDNEPQTVRKAVF